MTKDIPVKIGKYVADDSGTFKWVEEDGFTSQEEIALIREQTLVNTTEKLLFLLEAQLFHGCTRKEALMLWNDGIDTLYTSVEEETTTERGL